MLLGNFTIKTGLAALRESYNKQKRPTDADFLFIEHIVETMQRDFGEKYNDDLARYLQHVFCVGQTIQPILIDEQMNPDDTVIGIASALLHDIGYIVIKDRFDVFQEFQKKEIRETHMKEGANYTKRVLGEPPHNMVFSLGAIEKLYQIILVHDYPSLPQPDGSKGRPLDLTNKLSYILREADRLWMTSPYGFQYDLVRLQKKKPETTAQELFNHTIKRYKEERLLYPDDGIFNGETLFRTQKGYAIFLEQKKNLIATYSLSEQ